MRAASPIVLAVILIILAATQGAPAAPTRHHLDLAAQSDEARKQAPIGHRQPRMRDLPPDLAKRERSGQPAELNSGAQILEGQRALDRDLTICRPCRAVPRNRSPHRFLLAL